MEIDVTKSDPINITTEAGTVYRLYRHGELHPRSKQADEMRNRVYLSSQDVYGEILNSVEYYEYTKQVKPKDESKIIKLWKSTANDSLVDCIFLEDCIPFSEEEKRERLIPREEYKTAYQWKEEEDREIKAGAVPVHKEFFIKKDYVEADYYHISDTEPIVYRTKRQWRVNFDRLVKPDAPFIEKILKINGEDIKVKFYLIEDTYDMNDKEACDKYGEELRTKKQWLLAGRKVKKRSPYEEKTYNIRGEEKTYRYYRREDTEPVEPSDN